MSNAINEPEARALREEAARHQQAGAEPDVNARIDALQSKVDEHQRTFDTMTGTDGINVALPVFSLDVTRGSSQMPQRSVQVDFWLQGILVREPMVVAGSPSATV